MKLKYQMNLVAVIILLSVGLATALAGVLAISQVSHELNRKLLTEEVKTLIGQIADTHQILQENRVDKIYSYVERAKLDLLAEYKDYPLESHGRLLIIETTSQRDVVQQEEDFDPIPAECIGSMVSAGQGFEHCVTGPTPYLMSFALYPEWEWLLIVAVPEKDILAVRNRFLFQVGGILLGSLLAGTGLFFWFNGRVIRPINQLAVAATRVSQGKWDTPLPQSTGNSEVARLSRIFQKMSSNLEEMYSALQKNLDQVARSREELRLSQEQLKGLVESTSDIVWEVDQKGAYTYVSPQVSRILGINPDEVVGKRPDEIFSRDDDAQSFSFVDFLDQNEPFSGVEWHARSLDGDLVIMESSGQPFFNSQGERCGFRGIDRDITDRKEAQNNQLILQDQLLQAQKMESVGRLAGGVAHDYNNMLGVIVGNVDLALAEAEMSPAVSSYLVQIRDAAQRSVDITRQLLTFARKQSVNPGPVDLNGAVSSLLVMLRRLIGEDIELIWKSGIDIWSIELDSSQLDQILVNLCVNGRDAIQDTGTITIATENRYLDESFCSQHPSVPPGEYVMLSVCDDGSGMDLEVKEHLFEPFFTTKDPGKGTGLGLATVYGIIGQNNGLITVDSVPGEGTTIAMYFPRHEPQPVTEVAAPDKLPVLPGQCCILLVEDEQMVLKMTAKMLERTGCTVLQASTPAQALAVAREQQCTIDLLMTDVVMPEMNGLTLMNEINQICPMMKCLFMSGYPADVIAHHGVLSEGFSFIEKPFTGEGLEAKIAEVLGH